MKKWAKGAVGLAIVALGITGWNLVCVTLPVARVLDRDPRNAPVSVVAYHRGLVLPDSLVIDVWGARTTAGPQDMLRALLQTAATLGGRTYDTVVLAYHGRPRFTLPGFYFQQLGHDYDSGEDTTSLIRTLPQNVRAMDGSAAFETWTGGMAGVQDRQMEDVRTLSRLWWMDRHSS